MTTEAPPQVFSSQTIKGQPTLAAIALSQSVDVGSRMVAIEEYTLDLMQRDLQFMSEQCNHFGGRVLRPTNDGLLVHFTSALEAVKWAVEMQKTFLRFANDQSTENVLSYRFSIHWGRIFVSQTNALGNGVNIATMLLSEAEPGTICISQPVYEAIKNATKNAVENGVSEELSLEASYLGLKELGNVQAQSVYQVRPILQEERTEIISHEDIKQDVSKAEDSQASYPDISHQVMDEAIHELEKSEHLTRIKKLIFYICLNTWENDKSKLAKLKLSGLVQELIEIAPSLDQLKILLSRVVKTLSKSSEYSLVANIILSKLSRIYANQKSASSIYDDIFLDEPLIGISSDPLNIYDQIARELEYDENIVRIKKLVVYVCTHDWQNDPDILNGFNFSNLIQELYKLNPTLERLRFNLGEVIKTITKQAEYIQVASTITEKLQRLYPNEQWPEPPAPKVQHTVPTPEESPYQTTDLKQEAKPIATQKQLINLLNLFDLRLDLIKYVNPLKVKMLLFSTLNKIDNFKDEDLAAIKTVELDDLLRNLLYTYKDSAELESHLNNALLSFDGADQFGQVADVVVRATQPVYARLHNQPSAS